MLWIGAAITVLVFVAIILKFDTKLSLIIGGFLMCLLSGKIGDVVPAYCASLVNGSVVYTTVISMGYAKIMTDMGCCDHLIYALISPVSKVRKLIVPFCVYITAFIAMGLGSAATVGSVAGSLLIPLMTALGIPAALAAATVLQGTCIGLDVNPGGSFTLAAASADPNGVITGKDIINAGFVAQVVVLVAIPIIFAIIAKLLTQRGEEDEEAVQKALAAAKSFKVNPLYAILPIVPLTLVLLAQYTPVLPSAMDAATCMWVGFVVAMIVFAKDYQKVATMFFRGQGDSFFSVITLMASAAVFTKGMGNIGLTGALVNAMKANPNIAAYGGAFGPMLIAALSGSGNAAMLAFFDSVLPHAETIGLDFAGLAAVVLRTGNYGRTFSPVAAVTIIVCRIAGVDPMKVVKYTVVPMLIAVVIVMLMDI